MTNCTQIRRAQSALPTCAPISLKYTHGGLRNTIVETHVVYYGGQDFETLIAAEDN